MPGLFLLTPGTCAALHGERMKVEVPPLEEGQEPIVQEVPLRDIEHVVLSETAHITTPALAECMRRNIPVMLVGFGERVLGLLHPPAPHSEARLAQYRMVGMTEDALELAVRWVQAKIMNQRRVLQRLSVNRPESDCKQDLMALGEISMRCTKAESLDTLRGYEGAAAGRYFELFGKFFPPECPFERRSRRPPHNPVNAILSYAYTLIGGEMECQIHAAGLDPCIGFFHETEDRRPSLALDMIEPFRPVVADAMALDLVSHGTMKTEDHFEYRDGGCFMNLEGKKRFFVAYERRMNREFLCEQTGKRTTIRKEFYNQAVALKLQIMGGGAFEAFIMN